MPKEQVSQTINLVDEEVIEVVLEENKTEDVIEVEIC